MQRSERRRAEHDVDRLVQHRVALHGDAEVLTHRARIAVAADEEFALQAADPAAFFDLGGDVIALVFKRDQARAVAQGHGRQAARPLGKNAVEDELRAMREVLWALRQRRRIGDRGHGDARKLVSSERGDKNVVERKIPRKAPIAHALGNAPASAELHRSDAGGEHLRVDNRAVALLDQRARHAAPAELDGECQAHGAAADD
jgi:hypothetical protein